MNEIAMLNEYVAWLIRNSYKDSKMNMSERETDFVFEAKITACEAVVEKTGSAHGLDLQLVEFAVEHYGRDHWGWCADMMLYCGDAYTMMRERMGEWGMY